jgi:hypothetical protein
MTLDEMRACLEIIDQTWWCLNCGRADWMDESHEDPTLIHAEDCPLLGNREAHAEFLNLKYIDSRLGRPAGYPTAARNANEPPTPKADGS